ncbi:nickel-dependent hydrogenase large subunit [Parabacteroides faecis]|uniref:nickel-dependent hydrogenase large subunit n=1 Tax=Parabacteroides faecis TaxID=1217282 RepID=UPI00216458A6|nr:nickel-dependent hydrogenase large subunit [Parabacteroides faecis]MCS2893849.1 nickel-dependent hydrogenase large subunit [Parabacteroides faecis]UVQ47567.1 nickel-dependent hydrogenase large subunit [Parabacteroides faecis]
MSERIVIDPITRIEGHLRVEAAIEGGKIKDAYSSGTMVRGIENIVRDRDPRDAWVFVGRVCGVCTSIHSLCSVRAVEQALDITIPPNAEMVRNIMEAVLYMHDHTVHFYQLHALDWVDIVSALKADPKAAALLAQQLSPWAKNTEGYFRNTQERLKKFVASGQLGIFANGYWGHPAYKLTPEQNLIATVHYLDALEWQKEIVKVHAVFGGKNPHPNFLVGGMPCSIDLNEANAINAERLALVKQKLQEGKDFIDQVYIPDLLMIAEVYKDEWSKIGGGVSNYLSYGDFPLHGYAGIEDYLSPRGIVLDRDLSKVHPVDANSSEEIKEYIYHSWYKYTEGDKAGLHPYDGETNLEYTGPKPPYKYLDVEDKYSWIKTPRWKGQPMEVGPLARLIVAYAAGKEPQKTAVDNVLRQLNLPAEALFSTLGRTAARGIETQLVAGWSLEFFDQLMKNLENGDSRMANPVMWENENWPKKAQGVGLTEAPRGALAHFIVIENNRVKNYQMVVPTTWNASPRDENGNLSPYESALIGTPIHDANQPLEILRTIHSFDPCLACAVHLYDEEGKYVHQMDTF